MHEQKVDNRNQKKLSRFALHFQRIAERSLEQYYLRWACYGLIPAIGWAIFLPGATAKINIALLHIFVTIYLKDYVKLQLDNDPHKSEHPASPLHVFLVAWFLPFILTACPTLELHLRTEYIELVAQHSSLQAGTKEVLEAIELETVRWLLILRSLVASQSWCKSSGRRSS